MSPVNFDKQYTGWNAFVLLNILYTLCKHLYKMYAGLLLNEPVHEISINVVCATSKASDQPAHTRSLIRAFASRFSFFLLLSY